MEVSSRAIPRLRGACRRVAGGDGAVPNLGYPASRNHLPARFALRRLAL